MEVTYEKAERTVNNWVVRELSPDQFSILVEFVMQNGPDMFKRSSLLKRINRGDFGVFKELEAEVAEAMVTNV